MPRLVTAETFYPQPADAAPDRAAEWAVRSFDRESRRMGAMPLGLDTSVRAEVEAEHGRWIVRCPWCPSAQVASPGDRRFYCVDCRNAGAGGRWVRVAWPPNPDALERVLAVRPTEHAHWRPGETLADLRQENADHGLGELTQGQVDALPKPRARAQLAATATAPPWLEGNAYVEEPPPWPPSARGPA